MVKSELIARLAEQNPHFYARDVERIVNTIIGRITDALVEGDRVELRNFGSFSTTVRDAREGRNPKTGAVVSVKRKTVLTFRVGKGMQDLLKG
ncbi:HU family DNA-binding protein [Methylobacterium sp. E-045]|uniref:HU family DNA-binding protein n=1 Tax=Methylobacterium sp. E-045 TaxID=2836575 RepID=UPI001FB9AF85|nr:HU family DNA-binding protein [Methylobacterium sp. E-045]MCJ2127498.1 integration host factor subunit beta [Methylobacterium sp. E-045]